MGGQRRIVKGRKEGGEGVSEERGGTKNSKGKERRWGGGEFEHDMGRQGRGL